MEEGQSKKLASNQSGFIDGDFDSTSSDEGKVPIENKVPLNQEARWVNNQGENVEEVFGFNENAELVNGRTAMVGFLMLLITELIFKGLPVTKGIFGIG